MGTKPHIARIGPFWRVVRFGSEYLAAAKAYEWCYQMNCNEMVKRRAK